MEPLIDERNRIRNYLLGVPEPMGAEDLETRLLSDNDFLRQFSLVKDELMDDYVSGALSEDETIRFEKHFLSTPRRVLQVEIVRGLTKKAAAPIVATEHVITSVPKGQPKIMVPVATRSRYRPIAAVFAVVMLAGVFVWIITRSKDPAKRRNSGYLLCWNNSMTRKQFRPSQAITSITLKQVYVRGQEDRRIVVSQDKTIILLQLEILADTHESFRASLQTGEGMDLGMVQNLKPDTESKARILKVKLPTDKLTAGSYQIKLEGLNSSGNYDAVGLYPFQVVKS